MRLCTASAPTPIAVSANRTIHAFTHPPDRQIHTHIRTYIHAWMYTLSQRTVLFNLSIAPTPTLAVPIVHGASTSSFPFLKTLERLSHIVHFESRFTIFISFHSVLFVCFNTRLIPLCKHPETQQQNSVIINTLPAITDCLPACKKWK